MGTKLVLSDAEFDDCIVDVKEAVSVEIIIDSVSYTSDQNVSFSVVTATTGYEKTMPTVTFGGQTLFTQSEVSPWKYYVVLDEGMVGAKDIVATQMANSDLYRDGHARIGISVSSIYQ